MLMTTFAGLIYLTLATTLSFNLGARAHDDKFTLKESSYDSLETRQEQLEEKLAARQRRSDDKGQWEAVTALQAQEIASLKAQLQAATNKINTLGSTFVRWGRSQCPSNSQVMYTGIVGGAVYSQTGGGANRLCLTHSPQFDLTSPLAGYHTDIAGAEWFIPGHDHTDVPCAVCRVPHPTTVMLPGTAVCPQGWTVQYSGHIMAAHVTYAAASEFVCVDGNPEDREGGAGQLNDGSLFMYSVAKCGTLPCPPYQNGKVVLCAVCSM